MYGLVKVGWDCQQILNYPFFRRELSLIIEYGQVKSKLGAELSLYADECWEEFFSKINHQNQGDKSKINARKLENLLCRILHGRLVIRAFHRMIGTPSIVEMPNACFRA